MQIICTLVQLYTFALIGRVLLSWFPISPESPLSGVFSFLYAITEPVLGPLRRALPPMGVGGMGLDLSPIIATFGISLLSRILLGC